MKDGRTIQSLAAELQRIRETSRDIIVPTSKMRMDVIQTDTMVADKPRLFLDNGDDFGITDWAHGQIATYSNIPKQYYDRILLERGSLLSAMVNHGFVMAAQRAMQAKRPKADARLIRTTDGYTRAFLSDRYRILDCYDLFNTVAPILIENQFEVKSCEITQTNMYIKAVTSKVEGEVKPGHPVQYGIVISSSDVGCGSVRIEPLMFELVCSNRMIMEQSIRKMHIGKSQMENEITDLLTDETRAKQDEAFWMTVRDTMNGTMKEEVFQRNLNTLRKAANQEIRANIPDIVELTMKEVGITGEDKKLDMVNYLANGADGRGLNKWSLANAFTFIAQSEKVNYDESTELERAGAKIIELSPSRWEVLNKKAA